jgi:hypothetical protein
MAQGAAAKQAAKTKRRFSGFMQITSINDQVIKTNPIHPKARSDTTWIGQPAWAEPTQPKPSRHGVLEGALEVRQV